ncbi:MAG: hypothetical protein Q9162_002029 [Coniocarpon cinnabarinum]
MARRRLSDFISYEERAALFGSHCHKVQMPREAFEDFMDDFKVVTVPGEDRAFLEYQGSYEPLRQKLRLHGMESGSQEGPSAHGQSQGFGKRKRDLSPVRRAQDFSRSRDTSSHGRNHSKRMRSLRPRENSPMDAEPSSRRSISLARGGSRATPQAVETREKPPERTYNVPDLGDPDQPLEFLSALASQEPARGLFWQLHEYWFRECRAKGIPKEVMYHSGRFCPAATSATGCKAQGCTKQHSFAFAALMATAAVCKYGLGDIRKHRAQRLSEAELTQLQDPAGSKLCERWALRVEEDIPENGHQALRLQSCLVTTRAGKHYDRCNAERVHSMTLLEEAMANRAWVNEAKPEDEQGTLRHFGIFEGYVPYVQLVAQEPAQ